jgi:DNA-binding Lrp family transcriptional regulator
MPIAYVLLNCELGHEADIINELKKLPGINDVEGCYGVYDMIVKISSDSMDKLKENITWHIRKIDKIKSTLTLIVIEGQGSHQD